MAIDLDPDLPAADTAGGTRSARPPRSSQWLAGIASAGLALGLAELLSGVLPGAGSPVVVVGARVIDLVPTPIKDLAISLFGTADKVVLVIGILVIALTAGALLGAAAARRPIAAVIGFAAFAGVGVAAAAVDVQARAIPTALAVVAGAAAGVAVLLRLLTVAAQSAEADTTADAPNASGRRGFLRLVAVVAGIAATAGVVGGRLGRRAETVSARQATVLPTAGTVLPPPAPGTSLDVEGLSPLFTPNADFYRIDTALRVPRVDVGSWRLRVDGMVTAPFGISYDDLLALPMIETDATIACVSNEVGGTLVGTARWQGVPLAGLLDRAGVNPAATQLVGRSVDGWTAGFPTAAARDGRDAIVAVAMNGEPLPLEHGFPARLIVPGLYGYVSATKWLSSIELTTWEAFDGYWVPRGWSKEGPIKTQSRIDVPRPARPIPPGPTAIAGVAWAPGRGIERVEVRIDDGPWQDARLADALADATWRQWVLDWDAPVGRHEVDVRATDGQGDTQTDERAAPAPDGATGWHRVLVVVEAA